jgi:hypothetical protein
MREVCERLNRLMVELSPSVARFPEQVSDAEFEAALDEVSGCSAGSGSLERLILDRQRDLERDLAFLHERAK